MLHMQPAEISTPDMQRSLLARLSADERARHERFRFEDDRHTYLVAHALVRSALAQIAGTSVHALDFVAGEHGRPEISAPASACGFRFNLSHTRGLVACAFTRAVDVGVDVEYAERTVELLEVGERVFSAREMRGLRALQGAQARERFFELWTLKEAYIKAIGKGFSAPLRAITFHVEQPDPVPVSFGHEIADNSSRWKLRRFTPTPTHRLAVAWQGRDADAVRCERISADQLL